MNIALILAKKGSIGLPGKNLIVWKGKTLLEHTIIHLKKSKLFKEIYVSTNRKNRSKPQTSSLSKQAGLH